MTAAPTRSVLRLGMVVSRGVSALAMACSSSEVPSESTDGGGPAGATDASPRLEDATPADASALPSAACRFDPAQAADGGTALYPVGTTSSQLTVGTVTRTFRVHVPPGYDGKAPLPVVLMFHGGGGSARQFEQASANMDPIADANRFITVYPDGTGAPSTWNGGGCCGSAIVNDVDDVGFTGALLDTIEGALCVDRRRVFASGMSNGAIFTYRLACELADRIAAVAPVAGTDMTASCNPSRPVAVMETHGTDDGHVPWDGGMGCGPSIADFTAIPVTMERWRTRDGCTSSTIRTFAEGDGTCAGYTGCAGHSDVVLCSIVKGGHSWPGGNPPADLNPCPGNGGQSSTFHASADIWRFFNAHPLAE